MAAEVLSTWLDALGAGNRETTASRQLARNNASICCRPIASNRARQPVWENEEILLLAGGTGRKELVRAAKELLHCLRQWVRAATSADYALKHQVDAW